MARDFFRGSDTSAMPQGWGPVASQLRSQLVARIMQWISLFHVIKGDDNVTCGDIRPE